MQTLVQHWCDRIAGLLTAHCDNRTVPEHLEGGGEGCWTRESFLQLHFASSQQHTAGTTPVSQASFRKNGQQHACLHNLPNREAEATFPHKDIHCQSGLIMLHSSRDTAKHSNSDMAYPLHDQTRHGPCRTGSKCAEGLSFILE